MKFNVNDYVRVKLTPTGKEILRKQFEERHERMPDVFKELSLPEEDEQGFSQWQMWRLFETFGNHVFLGCEPPFETEIEIVEKAFQHSAHLTSGGQAYSLLTVILLRLVKCLSKPKSPQRQVA